ncbi:hypothetical protein [Helicobacter sp. 11S02596-1]|uniref:hypothetical protein n=1 Tax=Helicobacter sp. 11S02596-1 TaxID=1476194 RepID=UPI000BA7B0A6|nr:hypothetical protein [Helicobacter sp. 11S02596-1]PAF41276.1 hypothetical protein BJI48_08915 [Helicobacter sp. 11S02596-1]
MSLKKSYLSVLAFTALLLAQSTQAEENTITSQESQQTPTLPKCDEAQTNGSCFVDNGDIKTYHLKDTDTATSAETTAKSLIFLSVPTTDKFYPLPQGKANITFADGAKLENATIGAGSDVTFNITAGTTPSSIGQIHIGDYLSSHSQTGKLAITFNKGSASDDANSLALTGLIALSESSSLSITATESALKWGGDLGVSERFKPKNLKDINELVSSQQAELLLNAKSIENTGSIAIAGAGNKVSITATGGFDNGTADNTDKPEHNTENMLLAIAGKPPAGWTEGRIQAINYAQINLTGNLNNHANGTIMLIDGAKLNITGDFKNEGWIISGAQSTNDTGTIDVTGKSTLEASTQIGLLSRSDKPLLGNRAYLILKGTEAIAFAKSQEASNGGGGTI